MSERNMHAAYVAAWSERAGGGRTPGDDVSLFMRALDAVWRRAHRTLGVVTLTAIFDRVLGDLAETHAELASVKLEASTFRLDGDGPRDPSSQRQLAAGLRLLVIEFLSVIGELTAEILTSALHHELSKVALVAAGETGAPAGRQAVSPESGPGEDDKP